MKKKTALTNRELIKELRKYPASENVYFLYPGMEPQDQVVIHHYENNNALVIEFGRPKSEEKTNAL
jgi:hypothetical protein